MYKIKNRWARILATKRRAHDKPEVTLTVEEQQMLLDDIEEIERELQKLKKA